MTTFPAGAKTRFGSRLFRFDARRRLQQNFSRCLVAGLSPLREYLRRGPAIVALNHVAFWDGFLLPQIEHAVSADAYCLMDSANLARLPFLRLAGAVPVDLHGARRAREDLSRAAELLDRPGRLLFVFPQGKQVPTRFPLHFQSGVFRLAKRSAAHVVPAGLCYDFGQDAKPEVRLSFGPSLDLGGSVPARRQRLERAVRAELDRIDDALTAATPDEGFVPLVAARPQGLPSGTRLLQVFSAKRTA